MTIIVVNIPLLHKSSSFEIVWTPGAQRGGRGGGRFANSPEFYRDWRPCWTQYTVLRNIGIML